jgi:hypothetical protein
MKNRVLVIFAAAMLAGGCATAEKKAVVTAPAPPPPAVVATPSVAVEQKAAENVRHAEALKAYPVNRYVDPNDPNVMHEGHVIYRREVGSGWNLTPTAPTVVQLGPGLTVAADGAKQPNPLPAELEQRIAEQNQLMASLIEQNESLAKELTRLNREVATIRQKEGSFAAAEEKK